MALLARNPLEEDERGRQQTQQLGSPGVVPAGKPGVATQFAQKAGMNVADKVLTPIINKGVTAATSALAPAASTAATTAATTAGTAAAGAGAGAAAGAAALGPLALPLLIGGSLFRFFNEGGKVMGPLAGGGPNVDTVPAALTEGEYVLNREATQMFGPLIEAMNQAGLKKRNQNG